MSSRMSPAARAAMEARLLRGATIDREVLERLPERVREYIEKRRRRGVSAHGTPMAGEEGHEDD